jgi:hypothetical protein
MKNQTIAQQLKVTEFPIIIKDSNGKEIYYEASNGVWTKREYNSNGKEIYYENNDGFWTKIEYNSNGNKIYYEDSNGTIVDNKPKQVELTMEEIAIKFGIDVNNLKIKK